MRDLKIIKTTDKKNNVILFRIKSGNPKFKSCWEVREITSDGKWGGLHGYVYHMVDYFYPKKIGWQEFAREFWVYSANHSLGVAKTRNEVITKMLNRDGITLKD